MNLKVYYVSPKGCSEMVAEAIAREVNCTKEPLMPAYPPMGVAIMFLGCDGTKPDKVTMDFINSLTPDRVRNAALFNCNAKLSSDAIEAMKAAIKARGVNVLENTLILPGKGLFGGKKPGPADLEAAKKFAKECVTHIHD